MTPKKIVLVLLCFHPDTVRHFLPPYIQTSTTDKLSKLFTEPSQQALHPALTSGREIAIPRGARPL